MRFNHTRLLCQTNSGFLTGSKYSAFFGKTKAEAEKTLSNRSAHPLSVRMFDDLRRLRTPDNGHTHLMQQKERQNNQYQKD